MADLKMVLDKANEMRWRIDSVLKCSTYEDYEDYEDLSGLEIDYQDGKQLFLLEELQAVMRCLDEVNCRLEYSEEALRGRIAGTWKAQRDEEQKNPGGTVRGQRKRSKRIMAGGSIFWWISRQRYRQERARDMNGGQRFST